VAAGFAEDFNEQVGGTVDDRRAFAVGRDGVDVAAQVEDFIDCIKASGDRSDRGEHIEGADTSSLVALFEAALGADLPLPGLAACGEADDAGQVEHRALTFVGDVVAPRFRGGWQFNTKFGQFGFGTHNT
jgi:hypothetical protein